jgi:WD40 repeat protein
MGNCDGLTFTPDGRYLLEAGDDKVVRIWKFDPKNGLDPRSAHTLRWSIWREERGAIYALALSPDRDASQVAIGGFGVRTGSVVVLDRQTGKVVHALTETKSGSESIWALAFSPSGNRVAFGTDKGAVWVWDLKSPRRNDVTLLGRHPGRGEGEVNYVRLVAFITEKDVLSVAQDGRVLRWDVNREEAAPAELCRFETPNVFRAALSPDRKWIAAGGESRRVEVRSLDGEAGKTIELEEGNFPQSLAFDRAGRRLAVGVRTVPQDAAFFKETGDRVVLYDLTQDRPRPSPGPRPTFHAYALAFHPDGDHLAVAGGDDHEVTLWDLSRERKVGEVRSPGSGLWGVALSESGRYLGFRDRRAADPESPNRRGEGPWRVFDLNKRKWTPPARFEPLAPREEAGGWTVEPSRKDIHVWYAVGPDGQRHALPLRHHDGLPRCYTFLEPEKGKPVQLVVGHYWGLSLFELGERGPRLKRIFTGHSGEVMAVAPSKDGKWFVSASRDQTIAAWSLAAWPSHPELGAAFEVDGDKLIVTKVDVGSPCWEAGLTKGDEVIVFAYAAKLVYNRDAAQGKALGEPEECLDQLRRAVPGYECYFRVKRAGVKEPLQLLTTGRQRPLWRFFPTRSQEWVLWMWRSHYYDTSTNGDFYIGWQVNSGAGDVNQTPLFYRAEQFRRRFHRPQAIDRLVGARDVEATLRSLGNTHPVAFGDIEPPILKTVVDPTLVAKDCQMQWTASPRSDQADQQVVQVEVWVNDYRFVRWAVEDERPMPKALKIPQALLRSGPNEITLLGYNRAGGRAQVTVAVTHQQRPRQPDLYGLAVGVSDYSKAAALANGQRPPNLPATKRDAEAMKASWLAQRGKLYANVSVTLCTDEDATREKILAQLKALATRVQPDDRLVLFLAGHGDRLDTDPAQAKYVFCCPDYDRRRLSETAVSGKDLYEALAAIPCRKVLFWDACHSGEALPDPIRDLTPGAKGLVVLAACEPNEESFESQKFGHGLFTYAVLEALDNQDGAFARADRNHDGLLSVAELFAYAEARLPQLLKEIHREGQQHPVSFPPELSPLPLVRK